MKIENLPNGWHLTKLRDAVTKVGSGITPKGGKEFYLSEGVPLIRSQNVLDGTLDLTNVAYISQGQHQQMRGSSVQPNDVLLNITGGSIGRSCVVPDGIGDANVNQHVCIIRTKPLLDPHYLNSVLSSSYGQQLIDSFQAGGGRQGLNFEHIKSFVIPTPPITVQHSINELSLTWDEAIHLQNLLLEDLRARQRALAQHLLLGDTRLPEFTDMWKSEKAGEVFQAVSVRNQAHEQLLSATQERGIIPRSMLEARVTMPEEVTGSYKLVEPGDFVISLRSFQGGLEYSEYRGLVSPAYIVLKPRVPISDAFYQHYFKSIEFIKRLAVAIVGIRDGKQISFSDFAAIRIPHPAVAEQQAIADVLNTGAAELRLRQTELTDLREQKRGLMQQLLTGQVLLP